MYLFQRLFEWVRGWSLPKRNFFRFEIEDQTIESLRLIADREQRTPEQIAERLVNDGLRRQTQRHRSLVLWQSLTPREQEVTALVCLHYTNRQIAGRLRISPETVKTHVAHVLAKYGAANRSDLRQILWDWDFSDWGE